MERPERLDLQSADGAQLNLDALYQIAPSCFTEATDPKTGKIKRVVNFDVLRQLLGDDTVEDATEAYEFNWVGKQEARAEVLRPINKTLRPVKEDSVDWDNTQNLYIEGDNLEVLKLLQKSYLGKVKMIYIDPPYNTGNDFVYHDDFARTQAEEDLSAGNVDELGNRYRKNTDSNGKYHSDWCSMIYSRLMVARSLLSEDGVIFISIDDNEVDNLKKICDEVFGEINFVGQLILKTATDNNPSQINIEHEYMLCYAKIKYTQKNWTRQSEAAGRIIEQYKQLKKQGGSNEQIQKELRKWIKANKDNLPQVSHYNNVDNRGVYSSSSNSSNPHPGGYMFDIIHPKTGKACPKPANGWRWPEKTFWAYDQEGDIEWGVDETTQPHVKKRIETSVEYLRTLIYEDNRATTMMLAELFDGHKIFDNPKPVNVLARILEFVTSDDDIILDFFSGSASTAHAVIQLNAKDNGKRRFIMVQIPENTDAKSEAYKAGYKNICEIGKERIRRAGKKIKEEHLEAKDLDTGFRVFRIDESNFEDVERTPKEYNQDQLDLFLNNVKSDRNDLDLLLGCMLDWGVKLSLPMSSEEVDGKMIYTVNDGDLVACFAEKVTDSVVKAMADKQPLRVIFRDSCFEQDADKINIYETFKQLLDWSDENVKNNIRVI